MRSSGVTKPKALAAAPIVSPVAFFVGLAVSLVAAIAISPTRAAASPTAPAGGGTRQQSTVPTETRLYAIRYAELNSAHTLAETLCREAWNREEECAVEVLPLDDRLAVVASPLTHERITTMLAEIDRPPLTQSFHIVVLAAERAGGAGSLQDLPLPASAITALQDLASLLSYDDFQVLDSGWLRTAREAETNLSGPSDFKVELQFRGSRAADNTLLVEHFRIYNVAYRADGEYVRNNVINTSFTIGIGETVVVGTSKLDGNETALIVLVTAPQ